jgi:hypothetical protein
MSCFVVPLTAAIIVSATKKKIPAQYHVGWLLSMLWGGVAWLIPEHIYHGEIVLYPPFFTAGIKEIIPEIIKVGIPMVIATVGVWIIMLTAATFLKNKKFQPAVISLMFFGAVIMIMIDKILAL